jgi:multiple sugar transport system ATP-binding protein
MATVRLEQIVKRYAPDQAPTIDGVNLTVADGEFFILLGPSGCGKSTLLRTIAGLEQVSSGQVHIGERRVDRLPAKERDLAMVFQSYALYPHMTVRDNLAFGLKMRGTSREEIARRIAEAAPILGLDELLDRLPKQLSGGQRQRVALGRAIVRDPQVFLLDEPLSNLDAKLRGKMRVELKRLHQRLAATMIYVTHDQTEAMTLGDRVAVLHAGRLQQVGTPLEVYEQPTNRFVAGFLGNPPMNFLRATVSDPREVCLPGNHRLALGEHLSGAAAAGSEVELGIRPEDVDLQGPDGEGLPVTVAVVEPLGAETLVTVDSVVGPLVARVTPERTPRVGEPARLRPRPERAHLFEAAPEGARIGAAPGALALAGGAA